MELHLTCAGDFLNNGRSIPLQRIGELHSNLSQKVVRFNELSRSYKALAMQRSLQSADKLKKLEWLLTDCSESIAQYTRAINDDVEFTKQECGFSAKEVKSQGSEFQVRERQENDKDCPFACVICVVIVFASIFFLLPSKDSCAV